MKVEELVTVLTKNYGVWFTALTSKLRELATALYGHVNYKGNPHGTTASDLNLGNVPNYPVATEEEAILGKSNNTLLTPYLGVKMAAAQSVTSADIEELVTSLTTAFKTATTEIEQA